ncbi:MAG: hypothetical protein JSR64_09890 [Nitrospira sp.]|nr:hypothetical protein [Nitrospira sp.]
MAEVTGQRSLDQERIANFYHDLFVKAQAEDFTKICAPGLDRTKVVVDVGGGCGFFAAAIARDLALPVRVVDADPVSVEAAKQVGVDAIVGDALQWQPMGDESSACFNLILHHLVGGGEDETTRLQMRALERWKGRAVRLFINEYIYDSWLTEASGRLIYGITASSLLSSLAGFVSRFVPSLRANTFGVGVRFRGEHEWRSLFEKHGWRVAEYSRGMEEFISLPRRLLLIRSCRRDSFVLVEA